MFALGMYALIHVENRYTGVFFVLLWLGLFYSLHTTPSIGHSKSPPE